MVNKGFWATQPIDFLTKNGCGLLNCLKDAKVYEFVLIFLPMKCQEYENHVIRKYVHEVFEELAAILTMVMLRVFSNRCYYLKSWNYSLGASGESLWCYFKKGELKVSHSVTRFRVYLVSHSLLPFFN